MLGGRDSSPIFTEMGMFTTNRNVVWYDGMQPIIDGFVQGYPQIPIRKPLKLAILAVLSEMIGCA